MTETATTKTETGTLQSPTKKMRLESEAHLKSLILRSFVKEGRTQNLNEYWEELSFQETSQHGQNLNVIFNLKEEVDAGSKLYKFRKGDIRGNYLMEVQVRKSGYYLERDCYSALYDRLMAIWDGNPSEQVLLSGNAGIGKSWFQIYLLQRLMREHEQGDGEPKLNYSALC